MFTLNRKHPKIELVNNLIQASMKGTLKITQTKIMSFGSVFRPLHYLARVWGLAPYSIATNSSGELLNSKIHLYDGLVFLTTILLYLAFLNYAVDEFNVDRKTLHRETWILILCARLLAVFAFVYGIFGIIIINLINRFRLINMVNMYARFDEEVCQINFLSIFRHHFALLSLSFRWQKLKCFSTTTLITDASNYFVSQLVSFQCFFRLHQCLYSCV